MEYVFAYPVYRESRFRVFIESLKSWSLKKRLKDFRENDLLIN